MEAEQLFPWPRGKRAAISLTFDDTRLSQVDRGAPIMDEHGVKGTFYVTLRAVEKRLEQWQRTVANGHEVGNHTVTHPCSGNFGFAHNNALEDYTLPKMEAELTQANESIQQMLGVQPTTFAYPCGQKFVGRGVEVASYVPLVARHFLAGRGFRDEAANDPSFCDLAQIYGVDADAQSFDQLKPWIDSAVEEGRWLVFVAHEVGERAFQTMPAETLAQLCRYAQNAANALWIDTVAAIAGYVRETRLARSSF